MKFPKLGWSHEHNFQFDDWIWIDETTEVEVNAHKRKQAHYTKNVSKPEKKLRHHKCAFTTTILKGTDDG